jgi:hypothetical protein
MMEAVQTSETPLNSYQSTRRYNPEASHLRTHCRENLKSDRLWLDRGLITVQIPLAILPTGG